MDLRAYIREASLVRKFGLLSLIPIGLLGIVLTQALSGIVENRTLQTARAEADVVARLIVNPQVGRNLESGITRRQRRALDNAVDASFDSDELAQISVWNLRARVYARNRSIPAVPSPELYDALAGHSASREVDFVPKNGDKLEALQIYVPLQLNKSAAPEGAVGVALRREPIEAAIAADTRKLYGILLAGLTFLWLVLFRIVAGASNRLRRQSADNEKQAMHDALTGLPNRVLFRDRVQRAILAAQRRRETVGVMLMDLDHFKEINDTLGHFNGDLLLKRIASRLAGAVREADTVARLGGDEFAFLLPDVQDRKGAEQAVERVLKMLEEPFVLGGLALKVEASVGIALYPEHGDRVDALLQSADVAMYVAKEARGGYEFYDAEQRTYTPARLALVGELRRAIDENELELHYQPKADLATGRITGVEALARWRHPQRGLLPANDFIPLAEHTSLIRPVTLHLLELAVKQCRDWQQQGLEIGVGVNLSVQNLLDLQLPGDLAKLLDRWNLSPDMLELEITESMIMTKPKRAMAVINRLSEMGVSLAIDDFGTGYSSLVYLKQLPVSVLKIDKSFVMNMIDGEDDAVIVQSTVDLGRNLGLTVIAEGVETQAVYDRLREVGCAVAQGYFLSKPIPAEELTELLTMSGLTVDGLRAAREGRLPQPAEADDDTADEDGGARSLSAEAEKLILLHEERERRAARSG